MLKRIKRLFWNDFLPTSVRERSRSCCKELTPLSLSYVGNSLTNQVVGAEYQIVSKGIRSLGEIYRQKHVLLISLDKPLIFGESGLAI
jgi:hypothetical protein